MIKLSSGRPLPLKPNGRPDYSPGQRALGGALLNLPPHRFDSDNPNHVVECLQAIDLASEDAHHALAGELDELTAEKRLKERPRVHLITQWISTAMQMEQEVAELYERRTKLGSSWLKPE